MIKSILIKSISVLKNTILKIFRRFNYDLIKLQESKAISAKTGSFQINDYILHFPEGHDFVNNYVTFSSYQRNIQRLATFLNKNLYNFSLIDVGANIGDTAILVKAQTNCPILCIEGEEKYFNYLVKNTEPLVNVYCCKCFLSEKEEILQDTNKHFENGTMRLEKKSGCDSISFQTLDNLIKQYTSFASAKLLIIDTDGFDYMVIKGSVDFLMSSKPVLFFEYDPKLLITNAENNLEIFSYLKYLGYEEAIFYDNYGRLLVTIKLDDVKNLGLLSRYVINSNAKFQYYDVCLFHSNMTNIQKEFLLSEVDLP